MYEDWMGRIENASKLCDFTMPGSHDAGMYKCKEGHWAFTVRSAVTQFVSILEQLKAGARFFDIRVYKTGNEYRVGHFASKSKAIFGAYGPILKEVLDDFATFFASYRTEVVLIKFSIASAAKEAIGVIEETLRPYLYHSDMPENLAAVSMERLRGKILALFDFSVEAFPQTLHLVNKEIPKTVEAAQKQLDSKKRSILWLNGKAPEKLELKDVISKQNEKRAKQKEPLLVPHLEMYYLTITGKFGNLSVSGNTARQYRLDRVRREPPVSEMSEYMAWDPRSPVEAAYALAIMQTPNNVRMNVFMIDFVNKEVCGQILHYGEGTLTISAEKQAAFDAASGPALNHEELQTAPVQGPPEPAPPLNLDKLKDPDLGDDDLQDAEA